MMITREEIRRIPELHKQITRDREQLEFLREKATAVPSSITDNERVQTSPTNEGNKYIEAAVDLAREITAKDFKLAELQERAAVFIDSIAEPLPKKVMAYRYLKCCSWGEVSKLLGYDERYLRRLEDRATERIKP